MFKLHFAETQVKIHTICLFFTVITMIRLFLRVLCIFITIACKNEEKAI